MKGEKGDMEGICRAFWMETWHVAILCQNMSKGPKKNIFGKYILRGEVRREIISK